MQGGNYGIVTDVVASKGYQDFEWYVGNGQAFHKLYAGSNLMMGKHPNQILSTTERSS